MSLDPSTESEAIRKCVLGKIHPPARNPSENAQAGVAIYKLRAAHDGQNVLIESNPGEGALCSRLRQRDEIFRNAAWVVLIKP